MSESVTRGEIWLIRFDPSEGDEIQKVRPAVVMTVSGAGKMQLQIVVPITGWQMSFDNYFWMVRLSPSEENGLSKLSAADTFQIKSLSVNRFQKRLGRVSTEELVEISVAIALCVGYNEPDDL